MNTRQLDLEGKNVVIVEDDLPSIRYYETLLRTSGARINIFYSGREFVNFIKKGTPEIDIVIMDFLIPIINGIDCAKIFRKRNKNTPVLMITAYSSDQARTDAFIAGCNEFLLKPVYPEKICQLIEKYLKPSGIPFPHLK